MMQHDMSHHIGVVINLWTDFINEKNGYVTLFEIKIKVDAPWTV